MSAPSQSDEIVGVSHGMGFVEVVDAPNQTAFNIAPSAKLLHAQASTSQPIGGLGKAGKHVRPDLCPAVESGSEKGKNRGLHIDVFEPQVALDQFSPMTQPLL